jgi:putative DNA primase/helicase
MNSRAFTEEENRILNKTLRNNKPDASKPPSKNEQRIAELAKLPQLKYAQCSKQEAKSLGITVAALNKLVAEQRKKVSEREFLPHWNVAPWPGEIDGDALLDELRNYFRRYVVLPEEADVALALWVLHTWVFDCFDVTPYLAITSPTPRCGKTVLMTLLYWLCCRAKKTDSMSKAVIYRSVDADKPTLVLDEVNWICSLDDERAGIVNGGFERNGYVETCEGEGAAIKPKRWATYCPKALGMIGRLTSTLMDRSIAIRMRRKIPGEIVERLRRRDNNDHAELRQKCRRWADDNSDALKAAPEMVASGLDDRAIDCWEPLLIIAKQAGGEWLGRALYAAKVLSSERDQPSIGVELLADIRKVFGNDNAMRTADLVKELNSDLERPWVEWKRGKPLTAKQLGALLRPFGIISETVHIPGLADAKGYRLVRFEDAWRRYLPDQNTSSDGFAHFETSNRPNADETGTSAHFRNVLKDIPDGSKTEDLSHSHAGLDAWTFRNPQNAEQSVFATPEEALDDSFGTVPDIEPDDVDTASTELALVPDETPAQVEQPDNGDIPPFLRRCEQCGAPSDPIKGAVMPCDIGGIRHWLHERCDFEF